MKHFSYAVVLVFVLCGCASTRVSYVPQMQDQRISSIKNQYTLVGYYFGDLSANDSGYKSESLQRSLESSFPSVFTKDGKPFIIRELSDDRYQFDLGKEFVKGVKDFFLAYCAIIIPVPMGEMESTKKYAVQLVDEDGRGEVFEVKMIYEQTVSYLNPMALLFYKGAPDTNGMPCFSKIFRTRGNVYKSYYDLEDSAIAYSAFLKLKEIEEADELIGTDGKTLAVERYQIIKCDRVYGNDFAYSFIVQLNNKEEDGLSAFKEVQDDFRALVKRCYVNEHSGVKPYSLAVDFTDYSLNDGMIEGTAVVIDIVPVSLSYDAQTRLGKMAVSFNAGQYEEARHYIKRHIEEIALNSNIAHVEGDALPVGGYRSLSERIVDGNILEIEFKTEY